MSGMMIRGTFIADGDEESNKKTALSFGRRAIPFYIKKDLCFVTWARSRIINHMDFYHILKAKMPPGTRMYGSKELHEDGTPHYHVVMKFPCAVQWNDARSELMLIAPDGKVDTESINIQLLDRKTDTRETFLENAQSYVEKCGTQWTFGKWIREDIEDDLRARKVSITDVVACCNCMTPATARSSVVCDSCYLKLVAEEVWTLLIAIRLNNCD
jgi:hypothetical protein